MQQILWITGILMLPLFGPQFATKTEGHIPTTEKTSTIPLYDEMHLAGKVNREAFQYAVAGYERITNRKKEILTLIDFSKPSNEERLYVFDMAQRKILFTSIVAHGKNSGGLMATHFSNRDGSHQSSLGFYLTEDTYYGKNGYSLILEGLEKGINDHARRRAIVMHGAAYANPSVIQNGGRLGRSFGCPALPQNINRPIIDAIKGGSVLYIYAHSNDYIAKSELFHTNTPIQLLETEPKIKLF